MIILMRPSDLTLSDFEKVNVKVTQNLKYYIPYRIQLQVKTYVTCSVKLL